ncbi:Pentatricopeptide repeat protein [Raphanus sativus]|nr:Pentatricopeptide repeat protein [Raphanus sativus]
MIDEFGLKPDTHFYNRILNVLVDGNNLRLVESAHDQMSVWGIKPDVSTFNVLIKALCKATFAKRKLDDSVFLGNRLQISYAPEFESLSDTKDKLETRRKEVLSISNRKLFCFPTSAQKAKSSVSQVTKPALTQKDNFSPQTVKTVREKLNKFVAVCATPSDVETSSKDESLLITTVETRNSNEVLVDILIFSGLDSELSADGVLSYVTK